MAGTGAGRARIVNGKRRAMRGVMLDDSDRRNGTGGGSRPPRAPAGAYFATWVGAGPKSAATSGSRVTGLRFTRIA